MKIKLILSILFFIIFVTPVQSAIIRGGITFSVSEARKISFHNIPYKIPTDSFYNFRKFKKDFGVRYTKTLFSDNTFCITPKNSMYTYYYSEQGNLWLIQTKIAQNKYSKYARYNTDGLLDSVILDVGNNEQFVFDVNKKLIAHWIGKNGYDENGELFGTRD